MSAMSTRRFARLLALRIIAAVVLLLVAMGIMNEPPHSDKGTTRAEGD